MRWEVLIDDDATEVIGLHLETIREPARFRALAEDAARARKPIVAHKTGRSAAGARSVLAHRRRLR